MDELEKLREHILNLHELASSLLIERLEESTEFQRGRVQGQITAYDNICDYIRNRIKYHGE